MSYKVHFSHADEVIKHLSSILPSVNDPFLKAKYVGFVDCVPSLCCSQLDTESKAITKSTEAIMRGSDDDLFFHPTMIVKAYVR